MKSNATKDSNTYNICCKITIYFRKRSGITLKYSKRLSIEATCAIIAQERQEGDINRYMNVQSDNEEAADSVYNASLPFLEYRGLHMKCSTKRANRE